MATQFQFQPEPEVNSDILYPIGLLCICVVAALWCMFTLYVTDVARQRLENQNLENRRRRIDTRQHVQFFDAVSEFEYEEEMKLKETAISKLWSYNGTAVQITFEEVGVAVGKKGYAGMKLKQTSKSKSPFAAGPWSYSGTAVPMKFEEMGVAVGKKESAGFLRSASIFRILRGDESPAVEVTSESEFKYEEEMKLNQTSKSKSPFVDASGQWYCGTAVPMIFEEEDVVVGKKESAGFLRSASASILRILRGGDESPAVVVTSESEFPAMADYVFVNETFGNDVLENFSPYATTHYD